MVSVSRLRSKKSIAAIRDLLARTQVVWNERHVSLTLKLRIGYRLGELILDMNIAVQGQCAIACHRATLVEARMPRSVASTTVGSRP
jgi:hypothetical protein